MRQPAKLFQSYACSTILPRPFAQHPNILRFCCGAVAFSRTLAFLFAFMSTDCTIQILFISRQGSMETRCPLTLWPCDRPATYMPDAAKALDSAAASRRSIVTLASMVEAMLLVGHGDVEQAKALQPEPVVLATAQVEVDAALSLLQAADPGSPAAIQLEQLLRRSLPVVGEASAGAYARQREWSFFMLEQLIKGGEVTQTWSAVDLQRMEVLEQITEDALASAAALLSPVMSRSDAETCKERIRSSVQRIRCDLRCVAQRSKDLGGWAGCSIGIDEPGCQGVVGVQDPHVIGNLAPFD